jgi:hypothetical protein
MPKKGYKLTKEDKEKMSEAQKKRFETQNVWNKDRHWPLEVRRNISLGMKRFWAQVSEERRIEARERLNRIRPSNNR